MFLDMINILVHRNAIGLYLLKAQSLLTKGKGRLSFFVESSKKRKEMKRSRYLNLKIALIVLICLMLLIQLIISGMQLKGGDFETYKSRSNFLTYNLEKIVHGSFIREIFNYLVKLQALSVHVMHYMH